MKNFIKSKRFIPDENEFVVECDCGSCGFIKIHKMDEDSYELMYYTHRRHLKLNKCGWDIMLTKEQIQDIVANLQEMMTRDNK